MPSVRVNNVDIAYDDRGSGDGPPLLLVHGFPLDKRMWEPQVQALTGEFRIITADLRGHGESQVTPGPYTMDLLADDLKGLMDALSLQSVVLGGFSMGGYAVFSFYRKYPERVHSLMLLDTRPQPDSDDAKKGREDMAQLAEREGAGPIAERLIPRLLAPDTVANRQDVVDKVRTMITQCPVEGIAGDLRGMALREDSSDLLSKIDVPTLIVVGDQDAITPPAESHMMASIINGATVVEVSGSGHLSNLENPDEFNHAIHDFLHPH
ncbi:alpha/beta fold hydrolase [SAR202 cluster bacterium AC-647-N09_OGT_505m]|nr:alpha/beta fold hydrolase [SAR202 cluster bacterium AC-647-N09_OGT_505m]